MSGGPLPVYKVCIKPLCFGIYLDVKTKDPNHLIEIYPGIQGDMGKD